MGPPGNEKLLRKFRILVAPLDWGLGHATRCIPLTRELLAHDCEVWLAGEGQQEALLQSEFPQLPFLPLKGYRVRYSKTNLAIKIIFQVPKILMRINNEHRWLRHATRAHHFDLIISDNRFGLHHDKIPSVFITHQLSIKSKLGKWSEKILQRWNYKHINRFTECWVPDTSDENNLAGDLSHPRVKPAIPLTYIGPLSRFEKSPELSMAAKESDHLLFILSGPEPQRSALEDKILNDVSHYSGTATIVRGLPSSLSTIPSTGMIKCYNHLPARDLYEEIKKADLVISRSGYSTVMDLVRLQKKAVLIPTPGQTEQEYLAQYLHQKHIALSVEQSAFSLTTILDEAKHFAYRIPLLESEKKLSGVIENLLVKLK